jgi:hypothetical protein
MAIVGVGDNHTNAKVELLRAHGCPLPILAESNVYLMGVHLMGMYLIGMYLIGVYLMGVYLIGVHLVARTSWGCTS